jgi:membrane peptidoglycan carboxypeptidase
MAARELKAAERWPSKLPDASEKNYLGKLLAMLLSHRIEGGLSKDDILTLYPNRTNLGHRPTASPQRWHLFTASR